MTRAQTAARGEQHPGRAAWAFLVLAVLGLGVHLAAPAGTALLAFAVVALGSIAAVATGMVRHRAHPLGPWGAVLLAGVLLLAGAVLRATPTVGIAAAAVLPDLFTVPGYCALGYGIVGWLRARGAARDEHALLDALLLGAGAALALWALLVAPELQSEGQPVLQRGLSAVYPVLDAVLLALMAQLSFTQATRQPAYWLLVTCLVGVLVGDLQYALAAAGRTAATSASADAAFLVAYAAMGAAALHPSMTRLSANEGMSAAGWSLPRLSGIAVALLVPAGLLLVSPGPALDRAVRAGLAALLTAGVLVRTIRAVNQHAAGEATARHQATHDQLTALPNRVLLRRQLARLVPQSRGRGLRVSVLFLDLDGFKLVNDSHGHAVGDELLIGTAERLRGLVGEGDVVARLGGDEYVVVAVHQDRASAEELADRIIAAFAEPFDLSVGPVFVSPSIGISQGGRAARPEDAESLIRDADIAMYKAKGAGRNRFAVFDSSLRETVRTRMDLETALRYAVEREELRLHYQPIVDLADGRITGHEALLRWQHPERGMVSPAEFVPIAEETGLIVPLGAWVVESALHQLATWRAGGAGPLHVSVNVSARQLQDPGFGDVVAAALAETGLPASALWLELTETVMVENPENTSATLFALADLGVVTCVDDFGTGYSALGYLKRFPVSVVKVDRTFVAGLADSLDDEAIVRAVVAMAHALGLRIVAEGVETERQHSRLRELGCDLGQGWHLGRPKPPGEVLLPPATPLVLTPFSGS